MNKKNRPTAQKKLTPSSIPSLSLLEDDNHHEDEHQIIAQILGKDLVRKGIKYELNGVGYCSNRMEFSLIKSYQHCINTNTAHNDWYDRENACYQASRAQ